MILLPIFPQNSFEEEFLVKDLAGTPYLTHQLLAVKGEDIFICTNSKVVCAHAKRMGIPFKKIDLKKLPQHPHVTVHGAGESLKYLNDSGQYQQNRPLMVADYRFFPLQKTILANAFRQYQETRADALLSISPPEDNPCQVHQHFLINDMDILFLNVGELSISNLQDCIGKEKQAIDDEGNINLFILSRCGISFFDIEISTHKATNTNTTFTFGTSIKFKPASPLHNWREKKTGKSPDIHCLIRNQPNKQSQCNGKFLVYPKEHLDHIYVKENSLPPNTILRIFPIYHQPHDKQNNDLELSSIKNDYIGPVYTFPQKHKPTAVIIATLTPAKKEISHIFRVIPSTEGLWEYDPRQQATFNNITGKRITGRQNSVEVYHQDGAIIISTLQDFNNIDTIIKQGRSTGFFESDNKQIHICSKLDLLRLKIIYKTKALKPDTFLSNAQPSFLKSHHATQVTAAKQDMSLV